MSEARHTYGVRPRKDHRGVDLISDALPFGRLWYGEPNAISNAVGYAKHRSRSHDAVIRVYDAAGNVIKAHEHAGEFQRAVRRFRHEAGPTSPRAAGQSSRRRRYPTRGHRRRAAPAQHELRQHDARGGDAVAASVRHGGAAGVPVKWIAGVRRGPGQPHGATAAGTRSF
jgi:hypothetical protein